MRNIASAMAGCFALWLNTSHGASLQVSPTALAIPATTKSTSMVLENQGDTPIHAQTRVMVWRQDKNADQLASSEDVFASPPILAIPPRGKQVVRVVAPGVTAGMDYRVIVDELPSQGAGEEGKNVEVLVRYSIPLTVEKQDGTYRPASLTWHWSIDGDVVRLRVRNSGDRRAQLADLTILAGDNIVSEKAGLLGYVLGGAERSWNLKIKAGTPNTLRVRVNRREVSVTPEADR